MLAAESNETLSGAQLLPGGEWVLFTLARTAGGSRWNEAERRRTGTATGA